MKKGRRYIEPMTGRGDKDVKKRDVKKLNKKQVKPGMVYHGPRMIHIELTGKLYLVKNDGR